MDRLNATVIKARAKNQGDGLYPLPSCAPFTIEIAPNDCNWSSCELQCVA